MSVSGKLPVARMVPTLISFFVTSLLQYIVMSANEECLWSFGYGSNMDVTALESKKRVKVIGKSTVAVTVNILAVFTRNKRSLPIV